MSRALLFLLLGVAAVAVRPDSALAQRRGLVDVSPPSDRHGFWGELNFGWGEESYKFGNDAYIDPLGKPTFGLRMGGTVNPHLRLGFEWNIWMNKYQTQDQGNVFDVTETLNAFMAMARFYPGQNLGLFLKGGAGIGLSTASVQYGDYTSESGFTYSLGTGYEIKVGRGVFMTPAVDWYQHAFEQRGDATLHERLLNFSLAVTWQPGR